MSRRKAQREKEMEIISLQRANVFQPARSYLREVKVKRGIGTQARQVFENLKDIPTILYCFVQIYIHIGQLHVASNQQLPHPPGIIGDKNYALIF